MLSHQSKTSQQVSGRNQQVDESTGTFEMGFYESCWNRPEAGVIAGMTTGMTAQDIHGIAEIVSSLLD